MDIVGALRCFRLACNCAMAVLIGKAMGAEVWDQRNYKRTNHDKSRVVADEDDATVQDSFDLEITGYHCSSQRRETWGTSKILELIRKMNQAQLWL